MAYERKPPRGGSGKGKSFGGRSGGSSTGGGFKKSFGDKPRGRSFDGDRPKRDFGDRPSRPRGEFSDRPKRDSFGGSRDGARGDRPSRPRGEFSDRPKRDFGDRPSRPRGEFSDRPKRDFGDRPSRPRREEGDRPSRPRRDEGGEHAFSPRRAPRDDSEGFERKPRRDFGDKPRGRSFDGDRPKRDFGDRPSRPRGEFSDRPKRDFGDRPKRDFGDRPARPRRDFDGDRKPRGDFEERPRKTYERRERSDDDSGMQGHELLIYGVHAVQAALRNPNRKVTKLWVTDIGHEKLAEAFDAERHPEAVVIERRDIERKLHEGAVHQGLAAAVEPLPEVFLMDIVAAANNAPNERHVVVILDEVTDPHNVGAVLRSMSAFGAKAMITHKHNAPKVTGVMAKIATGAMEHVPMIPVVNISGAMTELKNAGFFILGLDENADYDISKAPNDGHICLVLGAEGEGLRALTRKTCDAIASIATFGDIKSLNVSNAAAISLFAVTHKKD